MSQDAGRIGGEIGGAGEAPEELAFDYARTVALSDGVFSIALTLLVLNISVPTLSHAHEHQLGHLLLERRGELGSYALSFAIIALFWVRHHAFFRGLGRIDRGITWLNLAYLGLVAFVPYPTRILGLYGDQADGVVLYAAVVGLTSLLAGGMRVHAVRADLLSDIGHAHLRRREHWILAPAVFAISIPIAFASPLAAKLCWILLLLGPTLQRRRGGRWRFA